MQAPHLPTVHVHSGGRLGNQLFQAAAAESARIRLSGRTVWHGSARDLADVRALLPIAVAEVREHPLLRRLLDADSRPMSQRGIVMRALYSTWWRSHGWRKRVLPDQDGSLDTVLKNSGELLIRDFHQRFESVAVTREALADAIEEVLATAVPEWLRARVQDQAPIAIHMRFGDFLANGVVDTWGQLDPSWFVECIHHVRLQSGLEASPLWIFSDDPAAAASALHGHGFRDPVCVNEFGLSAVQELALMAVCPARVISNSTFSWWSGYLAEQGALTVAPLPLMRSGERESAADPRWHRIPALWVER